MARPFPTLMAVRDETDRILTALLEARRRGEAVAVATVVRARGSVPRHAGTKMLVYEDGRTLGTVGGGLMEARVVEEAAASLRDGQTRLVPYSLVEPKRGDPGVCGGEVEIYVEPHPSPMTVYIIGCGHVGRALAQVAHWCGYYVVVTDDRPELSTPELVPDADVHLPLPFEEALAAQPVTHNTYVVAVTRNVMVDLEILPRLVETPAAYIGVIGSRRRWEEARKLLLEGGMAEAHLARFHSPVGLELNAETPEEIAVSILAEIIMLHRGGSGERMAGAVVGAARRGR